jgi:integrase
MITRSRSRGGKPSEPKSGRRRTVALSRRLRAALRERHLELGRPADSRPILERRDPKKWRKQWQRLCVVAEVSHHDPKDLRDTYASQLLTAGVSLGYVSKQLGHADAATTARHYAEWIGEGYREPMVLEGGEVPADLLARLIDQARHETGMKGAEPARCTATPQNYWWAARDSNPGPSG